MGNLPNTPIFHRSIIPLFPSFSATFFDSLTDSCRLMKMRRTKIVCTIGPASASENILKQLIQTGMNVARLNFSHGDYAFHRRIIRMIRRLERKLDRPIAILQDLPGPKIRIGAMEGNHVRVRSRQPLVLTTREVVGNEEMISVNYRGLTTSVKKGDPILLGDGEIELEVVKVGKANRYLSGRGWRHTRFAQGHSLSPKQPQHSCSDDPRQKGPCFRR